MNDVVLSQWYGLWKPSTTRGVQIQCDVRQSWPDGVPRVGDKGIVFNFTAKLWEDTLQRRHFFDVEQESRVFVGEFMGDLVEKRLEGEQRRNNATTVRFFQ